MTTAGFYKLRDRELFYAPDSVGSLDYDLHSSLRYTYEFPVDGWRWFDSESDARTFYGMAQLEAPEERYGPNYLSFYDAFKNSSLYNIVFVPALLQPGSDVLGNCLTIVAIALQDAMAGRIPTPTPEIPPNALQSAIWLLMSVVGPILTPENLDELQGLLDTHRLGEFYTLFPPQ